MKNKVFSALSLSLVLATTALNVEAAYPEKPVKIVVPFAPGSLTDVVTRELARSMQNQLKQTVIVENKPGASGIIGTQAVTSAPPDGYTLLIVGVTTAASNVSLVKNLPYDPLKDFTPLGFIADSPYLLVAEKDYPANNAAELFALAKKDPESVKYGFASGSAEIAGAKLAHQGGVQFLMVPYQSSPQILTDIIGKSIDITFSDFARGIAQVQAGNMKALGVTSKDRFPLAPEIPALQESGVPDYELSVWFGMVAPAGLPEDVQQRVSDALVNALKDPDLVKNYKSQGLTPKTSTPKEFGAFVTKEIGVWAQMIKDAGIKAK